MALIERTAYPRFAPRPPAGELARLYTPTLQELDLARRATRGGEAGQLAFLVMLKGFQRLGYFPKTDAVPAAVVAHLRWGLGLMEEVVAAVRRLRAGETLMPLEEVVELLRFAGSEREREYEARQAIAKLTPREIEVLQALAEGLDSAGIAERLHIALRTERNHMASILSKLGVHSQLQALVFALRHGVVETP